MKQIFVKLGKSNSKTQITAPNYGKESENIGNTGEFDIPCDLIYNSFQIDDKIQIEGQENDIQYANQINGAEYVNNQHLQYHQQYIPNHIQPIIDNKKQQNYNMQNYMNHPTATNTPFIEQSIGLVSNYDNQRNQIYEKNNEYSITENNNPNKEIPNEKMDTYAIPPPILTLTTSNKAQSKKQRNSSKKINTDSIDNQNNPSTPSAAKKRKRANSEKNNEVMQAGENLDFDKTGNEEQAQQNQSQYNIQDQQNIQTQNQEERFQTESQENKNNTQIPKIQKRKSYSQKSKENKMDNLVFQQGSQSKILIQTENTILNTIQQAENFESNDYSNNQQYQIQQNLYNDNQLDNININDETNNNQTNKVVIQRNKDDNKLKITHQQPQLTQSNIKQENEQNNDNMNQSLLQNQTTLNYTQNNQFNHEYEGKTNQEHNFVSNEVVGFENQNKMEEENQEQLYQIPNNGQNDLNANDNIQFNYQDAMQTPQLGETKKKRQKKNSKVDSEAVPKQQREKKQSTSDKSNATSSTSTAATNLAQNQIDSQSHSQILYEKNKSNQMNDTYNQQIQNQQNDENQTKIESIPPFQEDQIQQSAAQEPVKETKKRAPRKRKSKTSVLIPIQNEIDVHEQANYQQNSEPIQQIKTEDDKEMNLNNQNIFGDLNLMEQLCKNIENPTFQQKQDEQNWKRTQFDNFQLGEVRDINQVYTSQSELGLQQLDQSSNIIKINIQGQQNDQNLIIGKYNFEQIDCYSTIIERQQIELKSNMHQSLEYIPNDVFSQRDGPIKLTKAKSEMHIPRKQKNQNKKKDKQILDNNFLENNQNNFSSKNISEGNIQVKAEESHQSNLDIDLEGVQEDEKEQVHSSHSHPEKIRKKKSSKSSTGKTNNRKRKSSNVNAEMENNNENNSDQENPKPQPTITKEKSVHEKKRGIRDLTTDEKWDVYVQYDNLKSYRGVGRIFNMDHSTVKLLVFRINNERQGQPITKEIFLQSSIAQPNLEHNMSKKIKKMQKNELQQQNVKNTQRQKSSQKRSKSEKNSQTDPNSQPINPNQAEGEYEGDEQIPLFDQEHMNNQLFNKSNQANIYQEPENQDKSIKLEEKDNMMNEEDQLDQPIPEIGKSKSKKESKGPSSRRQSTQKRRSSTNKKSQQLITEQNQQLDQVGSQDVIPKIEFGYDFQQKINQNNESDQLQLDQNQQNVNQNIQLSNLHIKYEQDQQDVLDNQDYNMYQNPSDNGEHYQQEQLKKNNILYMQQKYSNFSVNYDENNQDNNINDTIQTSLLQIEQQQGQISSQIPPSLSETLIRSKSSSKMTQEEKQARKEMRKQFQEQQKAAKKEEKLKKKDKNKGQQQQMHITDQQLEYQDLQNHQNFQQNYDQYSYISTGLQGQGGNQPQDRTQCQGGYQGQDDGQGLETVQGQENPYYYQTYDPNLQYMTQGIVSNNYNYPCDNNYQEKYEDDYDNIVLDINNHIHQQQQQNQQNCDNDELKLEIM